MLGEIFGNAADGKWLLATSGGCVLAFASWVLLEGFRSLSRAAALQPH